MSKDLTRPQLRLATRDDVDAVAAVLDDSFEPYRNLYTTAAFEATTPSAAVLVRRLDEGPIWLATLDADIAGTVSARTETVTCHVRSMAVHPRHRGQGVGRLLLQEAQRWAEARRCARMRLETTSFLTDAIRLYTAANFEFTGAARDLFGTSVLEMEKRLPAVKT